MVHWIIFVIAVLFGIFFNWKVNAIYFLSLVLFLLLSLLLGDAVWFDFINAGYSALATAIRFYYEVIRQE